MWYVTGNNFGGTPFYLRWLARSADGTTWEDIEAGTNFPNDWGEVRRILRVDDTLFLLDENGQVTTTTDGDTFTTQDVTTGAAMRAIGADDVTPAPAIVLLGNDSNFYYSLDGGATWTDTGDPTSFVPYLIYVPASNRWVTAGRNPSFGDVGSQWHDGDPTVFNWFSDGISGLRAGCYDADNAEIVAVTSSDVYTSPDGTTWTSVASSPVGTTPTTAFMVHLNGITFLGTTSGRLYSSTDNATWSGNLISASGLSGVGTIRDIAFDGTSFAAVDSNANFLTSVDGTTWAIAYTFPTATLYGVSFLEASLGHGFFRYPLYWDQINREAMR